MDRRGIIFLAGINGLLATGLAAVGSHALPPSVSADDKDLFMMATQFHLFHALALLGIAALHDQVGQQRTTSLAAWLFQAGILAFSGSLYIRVLLGPGSLGGFHWITPLGGLALMAGWATIVWLAAFKAR